MFIRMNAPVVFPGLSRPLLALVLAIIASVLMTGCGGESRAQSADPGPNDRPHFVASVKPLGLILKELTLGRGEVRVLLSPGASPHTYEPKPSDARAVGNALAFFHVGQGLDDWATTMRARRRVAVLKFLPEEHHLFMAGDGCAAHDHHHHHHHHHDDEVLDPHFWTDPLAVDAMVPALVEFLVEIDPAGASIYRANGEAFREKLESLDAELSAILAPVWRSKVVLFHPSFLYMLRRYELDYAGVVEASPGKEATPRYLADLAARLRAEGVRAVFTEPQLNSRPAEALARETRLPLAILDPLGAIDGTDSYAGLLMVNAQALRAALQ